MKTNHHNVHHYTFLILLVCTLPRPTAFANEKHTASEFAADIARQVIHLVRETACLDARGNEDAPNRNRILARQNELDDWLTSHGRVVTLADCETERDKTNYREFKTTMAGHRLLSLRLKERRKRVNQVIDYFTLFKNHFPAAVEAVLTGRGQFPATATVQDKISKQLATPVRIDHYFFGRDPQSMIASVYLPDQNTMFLNLDFLAEHPDAFFDAFEHELWHHIVPVPEGLKIGENIWWEGVNELLSESFAYELEIRSNTLPNDLTDRSIEYPVQTAFMSLFLSANRSSTLQFATNSISRLQFSNTLRNQDIAMVANLGKTLTSAYTMTSDKKKRLETMLTDWGWKEDDGQPVDIGYLLDGAGMLAAETINREFRSNRRFLMDVIQALTVLAIQDIQRVHSDRDLMKATTVLPPHLHRNLKRVLEYCHDPYYQLSQK